MKESWLMAIDGGGALGMGPVEYLARVEGRVGSFQPQALAGTSVGALIVALAAAGYAWQEIREIFMQECPAMFEKPSLWWRLNPTKPKYDGRALRAAAQRYLGDRRMCDLPVPTFLTAFDFRVGRPKVFDCTDATPVWYAVLCSCAAPTYFPIVDGRYGDGGLVANNPTMVGIAGCIDKLGWNLHDLWCLSLGTNGNAWQDPHVQRRGMIRWLKPLIQTFMHGNEEIATFQSRALIDGRLLRIEPLLDHDAALDDVDFALGFYRELWATMFEQQKEVVVSWVKNRMSRI
jgi:predicted acylesterase/phospholipase RssA